MALVCRFILSLFRSNSKVKVIDKSSQLQEEKCSFFVYECTFYEASRERDEPTVTKTRPEFETK